MRLFAVPGMIEYRKAGEEFCSNQEILEELNAASLDCVRIVPISQVTDRFFVMARNRK